jgi:hypothetical protein
MNTKNLLSLGAAMMLLNAAPVAAKVKTGLKEISAATAPSKIASLVRTHTNALVERNRFGALKTGKTTATDSRLIAVATRQSDGSALLFTDSTRFKYSWGRGGDLKTTLKYDTAYSYSSGGSAGPLSLSGRSLGAYDAVHNQLSVTNQVYTSGVYDNSDRTLYTYNTANLITREETQEWSGASWDPTGLDKYTYNTAGKQVTDTSFEWNGSSWDYSVLINTTYTASGKEDKQKVYLYFSGIWLQIADVAYTYNTADNVASMTLQLNMSGTGLENYQRMLYTYDAAKNPVIQEVEEWDGVTWIKSGKTVSTFDASANVLMATELNWNDASGTYDSSTRNIYSYNSYNQVTSDTKNTYDGSSWIMDNGDTRMNYYYQDYSPTAISEKSLSNAKLELYPVPANDKLTIRIAQEKAEAINLRISDLQGRSLISRSYPAAMQIADEISTGELPAGQYFLQIGMGTTQAFTVAH